MAKEKNEQKLTEEVKEMTKNISFTSVIGWYKEAGIPMKAASNEDFINNLTKAITENTISLTQLEKAVGEIEENGGKKIYLQTALNIKEVSANKEKYLSDWKKRNIVPSEENYVRVKATTKPTFNYLYWKNEIIKFKYSEIQYEVTVDYDTSEIVKTPKLVNIVFVIDCKDGLVQLRFDSPGNVHSHKNEEKKSAETAFESYYRNLLLELFPDINFQDLNLNRVANHIATNEKKKFRVNRGVTTISNNAKQTFTSSSNKLDIRNLPEYEAAAAVGIDDWLTEDLTGYWLAENSAMELNRDLFMRISRRSSQIRVQRDCLEKELNYGIKQIREIQNKV